MLAKIIGVQSMNFTLDSGYHFEGRKLHVIDLEKKIEGLEGLVVTAFRIPVDHPRLANFKIEVGKIYTVYFEQDGKTVAGIFDGDTPNLDFTSEMALAGIDSALDDLDD